jgi:hypothetical protein
MDCNEKRPLSQSLVQTGEDFGDVDGVVVQIVTSARGSVIGTNSPAQPAIMGFPNTGLDIKSHDMAQFVPAQWPLNLGPHLD